MCNVGLSHEYILIFIPTQLQISHSAHIEGLPNHHGGMGASGTGNDSLSVLSDTLWSGCGYGISSVQSSWFNLMR